MTVDVSNEQSGGALVSSLSREVERARRGWVLNGDAVVVVGANDVGNKTKGIFA